MGDHGVLTAWIDLDYGSCVQSFGGFSLYRPGSDVAGIRAGHFIWRVLEVSGASHWDQLPGKPVRALGDDASVKAIGHFLRDDWFDPRHDFESLDS